jgi:hypothetical protein
MQCIFSYCKEDLSGDLFVVAFYATLVLATVGLSLIARSRAIRAAALLIAGAWALSLFAFFYVKIPAYYLAVVLLDTALAYHFWRMAKVHIFPAPLCVIQLVDIAFVAFALTVGLSTYWTLFVMNRLFELTLAYLIGCALFRLHILRRQRKSKTPLTGWRANFVVG